MQNSYYRCYRCMNKLYQKVKHCTFCGSPIVNNKILEYSLSPGTILNKRYIIGDVIYKNKNTLTYIAIDEHLESKLAILELFPKDIAVRVDSEVVVKNFDLEGKFDELKKDFFTLNQSLIKLRGLPNILKMFSMFTQNNTIYIVQELPKGMSFKEYLANNYGELSWSQSKNMFLDVTKLLRYLHSNKIVHCDLSPKTLFVENNTLKIVDFSNAVINNKKNILPPKLNDGYSAPEQYDCKEIRPYTDVYSLAAIMYKTLTGTKPVNSKSRLSNDNLLPPNVLNNNIPKNVSFAIMSALVLAPKLRTQTMKDFYDDLIATDRANLRYQNLIENEQEIKNIKQDLNPKDNKMKDKKTKKDNNKKDNSKKETKNLVFISLLISCGVVSFFIVITIFFLFSDNIFG